jgi:hypothetical protein
MSQVIRGNVKVAMKASTVNGFTKEISSNGAVTNGSPRELLPNGSLKRPANGVSNGVQKESVNGSQKESVNGSFKESVKGSLKESPLRESLEECLKGTDSLCESTVLVTGGAGFIGSHTTLQLLQEGYRVVVIDSLDNSSEESVKRVADLAGKNGHNLYFFQVSTRSPSHRDLALFLYLSRWFSLT